MKTIKLEGKGKEKRWIRLFLSLTYSSLWTLYSIVPFTIHRFLFFLSFFLVLFVFSLPFHLFFFSSALPVCSYFFTIAQRWFNGLFWPKILCGHSSYCQWLLHLHYPDINGVSLELILCLNLNKWKWNKMVLVTARTNIMHQNNH